MKRGTNNPQLGQGLVEYAIILSLVAVAVVIVLISTGGQYKDLYSDITTTLRTQARL